MVYFISSCTKDLRKNVLPNNRISCSCVLWWFNVFEGEKAIVFWIGLIILGLASVGLFGVLWMLAVWDGYMDRFSMLKFLVP